MRQKGFSRFGLGDEFNFVEIVDYRSFSALLLHGERITYNLSSFWVE